MIEIDLIKNEKKYLTKEYGLCIGFFDGLHLGHQTLLAKHLSLCELNNLVSSVFTFDNLPKHCGTNLVMDSLTKRAERIKDLGIEHIFVQQFSERFCNLSALAFLKKLTNSIKVRLITVGEDFHFGRNKEFGIADLKIWGANSGIEIFVLPNIKIQNIEVHSGLVRQALAEGKLSEVKCFLRRNFSISGKVIKNRQLGASFGFATANLVLEGNKTLLKIGVYRTRTRVGNIVYESISNLGWRPSIEKNINDLQLETHIFDYTGDLYNQIIEVEFLEFIREEQFFENIDLLKKQVESDIKSVKEKISADENIYEKAKIGDLTVYHLPSKRFLTNYFSLHFTLPNSLENYETRALIFSYLAVANAFFPNKLSFNRELSRLYDAQLLPLFKSFATNLTYTLWGQALKNFAGEQIFLDFFSLAMNCVHHPVRNFSSENNFLDFSSDILEKEAENLVIEIHKLREDKLLFSYQLAIKCFTKYWYDEALDSLRLKKLNTSLFKSLEEKDILGEAGVYEKIAPVLLEKEYHTLLAKSELKLYITGNFSFWQWQNIFSQLSKFPLNKYRYKNNTSYLQVGLSADCCLEQCPYEVEDEAKDEELCPIIYYEFANEVLSQTYIHAFYTLSSSLIPEENIIFSLLALFLAGDSSSFLFQEMRERNKLCYFIEAIYQPHFSFLVISLAVDKEKEDEALSLLHDKMQLVKVGIFSEELFLQAKKKFIEELKSLYDNPAKKIEFFQKIAMYGWTCSHDEIINLVEKISFSSFLEATSKLKEVFLYVYLEKIF